MSYDFPWWALAFTVQALDHEAQAEKRIKEMHEQGKQHRQQLIAEGKPVTDPNDPWYLECQKMLEDIIRVQCKQEARLAKQILGRE